MVEVYEQSGGGIWLWHWNILFIKPKIEKLYITVLKIKSKKLV